MEILKINGHDYSPYVKMSGLGWSRNDLDSDQTKRTKDGKMRRHKIGTKRKLSYEIINATREILAQLDDDLSQATFTATYRDLHGTQTRTFCCSAFNAKLDWVNGSTDVWESGSFNMIEV